MCKRKAPFGSARTKQIEETVRAPVRPGCIFKELCRDLTPARGGGAGPAPLLAQERGEDAFLFGSALPEKPLSR